MSQSIFMYTVQDEALLRFDETEHQARSGLVPYGERNYAGNFTN